MRSIKHSAGMVRWKLGVYREAHFKLTNGIALHDATDGGISSESSAAQGMISEWCLDISPRYVINYWSLKVAYLLTRDPAGVT